MMPGKPMGRDLQCTRCGQAAALHIRGAAILCRDCCGCADHVTSCAPLRCAAAGHAALKAAAWERLEWIGVMAAGDGVKLEMRNCPRCGSTLTREVAVARPPAPWVPAEFARKMVVLRRLPAVWIGATGRRLLGEAA